MTVPALMLAVLRYAFLLALVLFALRVLRVVLSDLDAPAPAAVPRRAILVVESPEAARGREFLVAGEVTVGRSPGCAIVLEGEYVSAHHARLVERGGRVWVEDLGSRNGTALNGRRLRRAAAVRPGDRLKIGEVVLVFRTEPVAAPAASRAGEWASGDGTEG